MKLPAWARATHPVARRETAIWQKLNKKWGWLILLLVLLPCGCSAFCSLSALPASLTADTPTTGLLIFLAWSLMLGVWLTSGLWEWVLGTFAGIGGAIMVARERETMNWSLLRLTTLSIREILGAKLAALGRLMLWPFTAILGLQTAGISLMVIGGLVAILVARQVDPADMPVTLVIELGGLLIGLWPVSVLYLAVASLVNLGYNSALGLVTSSYARTTGNAVVLTFVASFAVNLLVFVPLQQLVSIGIQLLGGVFMLATQSPVAFFILTPLASFILPVLIQFVLTVILLATATYQSERIVE
jgi:hypothetical protein